MTFAVRSKRLLATFATAIACFLPLSASAADDHATPVPDAIAALASLDKHQPAPSTGPYPWSTGEYHYDGAGNITAIGNEYFLYDLNGRLTSATVKEPGGAQYASRTYGYDVYGNLTSRVINGGASTPIGVDPATNHLNASGTTYDESGSVLTFHPAGSGTTYHLSYDALGMLQSTLVNTSTAGVYYVYTANDERYETYDTYNSADLATFAIRDLGGNVQRTFEMQITPGTYQKTRDYFYRDGLLLAAAVNVVNRNGSGVPTGTTSSTEHFSLDHLGTPRLVTDANGNKIGFHVYFPFGEEWYPAAGSAAQEAEPRKFTGHERDKDLAGDDTAIDYMHARYYSAKVGRFLSVDPLGGEPHAPQSWNRYSYVANNPMRRTDPDGRDPWDTASGFANAFSSNNLLGIGRVDEGNDDYKAGQHAGDFASAAGGLIEAGIGGTGEAVGLVLDTTGVGALLGVPLNVVSAGVIAHGATTTLIGTVHMAANGGPKAGSSGGPGAGKDFSKGTKDGARAESNNKCVFCGKDTTRQPGPSQSNIDHADPKSRNGNNTPANAQNTCRSCNLQKATKTTSEFLNWLKNVL